MKNSKVWIFILSIIVTIAVCFIPEIGNAKLEEYHAYGFPFDAIHVYEISGDYSFVSLGPYLNVAIYYFILLFIYKRIMKAKEAKA
jgi:hypothetical protein